MTNFHVILLLFGKELLEYDLAIRRGFDQDIVFFVNIILFIWLLFESLVELAELLFGRVVENYFHYFINSLFLPSKDTGRFSLDLAVLGLFMELLLK